MEKQKNFINYIQERGSKAAEEYLNLVQKRIIYKPCLRTEIYPNLNNKCFTDDKASGSNYISADLSNSKLNEAFNSNILSSYPLYYNEDKTPNARVGIFLWTTDKNNNVFLLFSKNIKSEDYYKSECFTDFGGKVDLKNFTKQQKMPENWLEAAQRTLLNQSGGFYQINSDYFIEKSHIFFRQSTNNRQIAIIFMPISYDSSKKLKVIVNDNINTYPKVKEDFIWISLQSILEMLPTIGDEKHNDSIRDVEPLIWKNLQALDNNKVDLKVRRYVMDLFDFKEMQQILRYLKKNNVF